jgi:hypothetical protein
MRLTTFRDSAATLEFSKRSPSISTRSFLESCAQFITDCNEKDLPRLAVEASLYYARIARLFKTAGLLDPEDRDMADDYHHNAMKLLGGAEELCARGFRNADTQSGVHKQASAMLEVHLLTCLIWGPVLACLLEYTDHAACKRLKCLTM